MTMLLVSLTNHKENYVGYILTKIETNIIKKSMVITTNIYLTIYILYRKKNNSFAWTPIDPTLLYEMWVPTSCYAMWVSTSYCTMWVSTSYCTMWVPISDNSYLYRRYFSFCLANN